MNTDFAENLKQFRADKKVSQEKLALSIGVTQQCVSEWEHRKTEPTLSYLLLLADFFDVSLDILCGRNEW